MIVSSRFGRLHYFAPLEETGFEACYLADRWEALSRRPERAPVALARRAKLPQTKVVDLFGEDVANYITYVLLAPMAHLILRIQPTPGRAVFEWGRSVAEVQSEDDDEYYDDQVDLEVATLVENLALPELFSYADDAGGIWNTFYPLASDRAILNIWYHPDDMLEYPAEDLPCPDWPFTQGSLFVVFHRAPEPTHRRVDLSSLVHFPLRVQNASALLDALATNVLKEIVDRQNDGEGVPTLRYVIVGVEQLAGQWLQGSGLPESSPQEQFVRRVSDLIGTITDRQRYSSKLFKALGTIEFMSVDDYRAERGSEQAALEIEVERDLRPEFLKVPPRLKTTTGPIPDSTAHTPTST
jgi:hypothetical protein